MSFVNYGVSKHYAGSMVSDRCPLGDLSENIFTAFKNNLGLVNKKNDFKTFKFSTSFEIPGQMINIVGREKKNFVKFGI